MKILVTTSTLPASDDDKVPAFVKDQLISLKNEHPDTELVVHAPHNAHARTTKLKLGTAAYEEVRYHYFWPYQWELLTGRGILPALKQNPLLYAQIPFLMFFQFTSLWSLARKEKPDIIYAHWFTPQAISSALVSRLTKTPFVFTTHAADVDVWHKIPLSAPLIRWVCRKASGYTAVSPRTANKLISFFDEKDWKKLYASKLSIIPMGVYLGTVPDKSVVSKLQKKFSIPADKKYLLFIGRIAEKKGITYLLKAVAVLPPKEREALHIIIAGDGSLRGSLEKEASELNLKNVTFTGYTHGEEKFGWLEMSDYVCLPSIVDSKGDAEGLPVVFMEGLAAGKVVLASDASSGETFLRDGVSGFVFPEKSAGALADTISKAMHLSSSQTKAMRAEAKKLAQQFSWDTIVENHYRIFKKVLDGNSLSK